MATICLALGCGPAVDPPASGSSETTAAPESGSDSTAATLTDETGFDDATTASTSADASSTGTPEPLPPGGLGPWGYDIEVFEGISAAKILVADFDGDGHADIFVQGPKMGPDAELRIERGAGDGLTFMAGAASVVPWSEEPLAGDFDGDGDLDVAAVDSDYGDKFFVALNGGGAFPASVENLGDSLFTGFGTVALDVTADGADDLFISGGHSQGGYVYASNGNGSFTFDHGVTGPACYFTAMTTGDFDGDGVVDAAGSGSCNAVPEVLPLVVYLPQAGVLTPDQMFAEGPGVLEGGDLVAVDFDDDGDLDLVTGSWPAGLTLLEGGPNGFAPPVGLPYAWDRPAKTIIPAQLGLDGPPALLLADEDAVAVAEQSTKGELVITPIELEGRLAGAADFNEDGRTDLAILIDKGGALDTLAIWLSH